MHVGTIIVVDPFAPGVLIEQHARARGRDVLLVASGAEVADKFKFKPDSRTRFVGWKSDAFMAAVNQRDIAAVVTGYESGVECGDALARFLGLPGNDPATSVSRRNKGAMQAALRNAGLRSVYTVEFNSISDAEQFLPELGSGSWIVKPEASGGGDNVYVCHTQGEVLAAASRILAARNVFLQPNTTCLLQPFIEGLDCTVNAVSRAGRHWVTDIWKGQKRLTCHGRIIYDMEDLFTLTDAESAQAAAYALKVLDALGIQEGASHTELKLSAQGPLLMESGARISGAVDPKSLTACLGTNQVDVLLDSILQGDAWSPDGAGVIQQRAFGRHVVLPIEKTGEVVEISADEFLTALPSYSTHRINVKLGYRVQPTTDLLNSLGIVELVSESLDQLEADYQAIRHAVADLIMVTSADT
jgi:biotin carboxylase